MKKLIRKGVFETNSSSCHSISISHDFTTLDTLYPDEYGNIVLNGGEFGWEIADYHDPETKANYVAVMLLHLEEKKKYYEEHRDNEESQEWMKYYDLLQFTYENYEKCKKIFEKVIKEQTGCNSIIYKCDLDYNSSNWSYIDHQSFEIKSDAEWLLDEQEVKMFIFNPNSELHTDNDNH